MKREAIVRAAYYFCLALNQTPSRRNVNAVIARQLGKGFRPADVAAVLKSLGGNHLGTATEPPREPSLVLDFGVLGTTTGTSAEPATLKDVINNNSSSLRSDGRPRKKRAAKREPDTSWVEPLIAQARTLQSETLRSLEPETGRLILGRYHALKFGNCTRNERANKAKGLQVASAIASMSRSQIYGSMTVGEYVGYARKVHEARDGAPWFDPWQIKAFCEFETGGAP